MLNVFTNSRWLRAQTREALLAALLLAAGGASAAHGRRHHPPPTPAAAPVPDARCGPEIARLVVQPGSIGPIDARTHPTLRVARKLFPGCAIAAGKADDGEGDLLDTVEVRDGGSAPAPPASSAPALRLIAAGPGVLGSVEILDPRIRVPAAAPAGTALSALGKLGALGCERGSGTQANLYECRVAGIQRLRFVVPVLPEDERTGGMDASRDRAVSIIRWYPPER